MAQNNSTLYLLTYNNYYNRIIKREANISGYLTYSTYNPLTCNFNPADGIDTEHIFNVPYVANTPAADYCVVVDENNEIVSRWFIVQATRTRGGQYRLSLHRDLLADYYNEVLFAPCYIERAMLNVNSPFIFNSENMRFNQIKKKEVLLKDKTNSAWIVGYMANNYYEGLITQQKIADNQVYVDFNRNIERSPRYEASYSELSRLGQIFTGATINNQSLSIVVSAQYTNTIFTQGEGTQILNQASPTRYNCIFSGTNDYYNDFIDQFVNADPFFMAPRDIANYLPNYKMNIDNLRALNNQYIKNTDSDGPEYFYFKLMPDIITEADIKPPVGSTLYNDIKTYIRSIMSNYIAGDYISFVDTNTNGFRLTISVSGYHCITSTEVPDLTARAYLGTMSGDTINQTKQELDDAPYTMFCMPYSNMNVYNGTDGPSFESQGTVCAEMGAAISKTLGGGGSTSYIYDLQLLPYCPIPSIYDEEEKRIDLTRAADEINYAYIIGESADKTYPEENSCGIILFPSRSSFSITIPLAEPIEMPGNAIDAKVDIETKFCRLVSPNYAGAFEFNPLKNGGVYSFEVNATYKPYQPYIHLNPLFNPGSLYGGDFNDNRGLICGGDFSLPQTSDAWITYQAQNKSYRESFNRQIENMETTYDINREQMKTAGIINAVTATVSGATSGAMAGSLAGGPVGGAVAGVAMGIAGGVASGIGLAADLKAADALQKEALSYAGDQFNYSLQNILALPNTVSRVSAFDINNKYFPFLEFYEATPEEERALRNKITYNSMSVMAIGSIGQYKQTGRTFIQGKLIRLENLGEDYHSAAAIAAEIQKGVYI